MPIYVYENPKTGKVKEVVQGARDKHVYEEDGVPWIRIWTSPNANTNSLNSINPFSSKEFLDKTRDLKGGTVGDLWDISKELSDKRVKKAGHDAIKEKTIKDYEKKCKGTKHPHAKAK